MKKILLVLLFSVSLCSCNQLFPYYPKLNQVRALKIGMTEDMVTTLLRDKPFSVQVNTDYEYWYFGYESADNRLDHLRLRFSNHLLTDIMSY